MIYRSSDGSLEVSVSDQPTTDGRYILSLRHIGSKRILAYINTRFGSGRENFNRFVYRTGDPEPDHPWSTRKAVTDVTFNIHDVALYPGRASWTDREQLLR